MNAVTHPSRAAKPTSNRSPPSMPTPSSTARRATSSSRRVSTRCAGAIARSPKAAFPISSPRCDGAIAGYAYAGPFRPRPAYRFVVEDSVYVAPQAKGRGIGRALMQQLIAEAQSARLPPDDRRHRRRPAGQRVGQAARGARLSPFGPARRLRLQARALARHCLHAACAEWRHGSWARSGLAAGAAFSPA